MPPNNQYYILLVFYMFLFALITVSFDEVQSKSTETTVFLEFYKNK